MVNKSKAKGTAAETAVVDYLRANGFPHVERRALSGSADRGDIAGILGTVIEVKACATTDLAGWTAELTAEIANDQAHYGAVWHKRRGTTDPGRWYATMTGKQLVDLLWAALHDAPTLTRASDDPARVLAVLEEMGWPDDREKSAHIERDGFEVCPAGTYWRLAVDIITAADRAAGDQTA